MPKQKDREKKIQQARESITYHLFHGLKYDEMPEYEKKHVEEVIISLKKKKLFDNV